MDKKGLALEELGKWIIALGVLVIIAMAIFLLSGKGLSAIDYIKDIFGWR